MGQYLLMKFPAGDVARIHLNDIAELEQLARGKYITSIERPGFRLDQPVSITRNQDVVLKLYTWVDLSVVIVAGVLFLVIPFVIGVKARRRSVSSRGRIAASGAWRPGEDQS